MASFYLLFSLISFQLFSLTWCKPSHVWLQFNGYNDIVIALPADCSKEIRPSLIQLVQELFEYSSKVLYVATKRRATFRNIKVIIPKSWGESSSWLPIENENVTISEMNAGFPSFDDADIIIASDVVERWKPYTLQDEGCGKTGLRIMIPLDFLMDNDEDIESKSIYFIHHWSQYRYGVFPEGGFEDDIRYPTYYSVPGTEDIKITTCTDIPISYNFTELSDDDRKCEPYTDKETGKLALEECRPVLNLNSVKSSLMDQNTLPTTYRFCEGEHSLEAQHNPHTPSKQNILCSQEGAWNIILKNIDFAFGKNPATIYAPGNMSFHFIQESNLRIIIAVDVSLPMTQSKRYELVKNTISKLILFDLPLETEVGLVFFADTVKSTTEMISLVSERSRTEFLEFAPFYEELDDDILLESSPLSALDASLQLLRNSSNGVQNGIIMLITSNITLGEFSQLKNDYVESSVKLITLFFQDENNYKHVDAMETLTSETKGWFVNIKEESETQMLLHLYMSMSRMLRGFTSIEDTDNIVLIKKIKASEENISVEFDVDSSTAGDLKVLITGADFDIINPFLDIYYTTLHSSSKKIEMTQKEDFIPAWVYRLPNAEIGKYTFQTKRRNIATNEFLIVAYGKRITKNSNCITSEIWINSPSISAVEPLKLFAEVKSGNHPIIEAKVQATIININGSVSTTFDLFDNGLGDPDITKHDGIYSRYIPLYLTEGYYNIFVEVIGIKSEILYISNSDCCGNTIPHFKTSYTDRFTRFVGPLTFEINEKHITGLTSGPNKILDLQINNLKQEENEVELQWTAAGCYMDHGAASSYVLKIFEDRMSAQRRFEKTGMLLEYNREITNFTKAMEYGMTLKYNIKLPNTLESGFYFFAVKAINKYEIQSKVSNVIEIFLENNLQNNSIICDYDDSRAANLVHLTHFYVIFICIFSLIWLNKL